MLIAAGFVPEMDNATAADFNRAAAHNVNAFRWWAGSTIFVGTASALFSVVSLWWTAIPAVLAIHSAISLRSCRRQEVRRKQQRELLLNTDRGQPGEAAVGCDRLAA